MRSWRTNYHNLCDNSTPLYRGMYIHVDKLSLSFAYPIPDGSSIHQPIFCCSSHSPDTCLHPVPQVLLPGSIGPSSVSLALHFSFLYYSPIKPWSCSSLCFPVFSLFIRSDFFHFKNKIHLFFKFYNALCGFLQWSDGHRSSLTYYGVGFTGWQMLGVTMATKWDTNGFGWGR